MWRRPYFRRRTGQFAARLNQLGRAIVMTTIAAVVARLVWRAAFGTRPAHKSIGQKGARLRIVELFNIPLLDEPGFADGPPKLLAQYPVFRAVRAAKVFELDVEAGQIALVSRLNGGDHFFFASAFRTRPHHGRGAMRVVGTHIDATVSHKPLESRPDVRLDGLEQIPNVDIRVDVRQGRGDEDSTHGAINQCE